MTAEQQAQQSIKFKGKVAPLPKITPSQKQFIDLFDENKYGVWIDDKKEKNNMLKNYKPSDFSNIFISKLHKNARTNVKYKFQADLMSNAHFDKY
jgi:bla regulator protein blaR1